MSRFPARNIGTVNGIETEYEVHWLDWDTARLTVGGEEVVTFSSAQSTGFATADGVLDEAAEVVFQIEEEEWD